MSLAVALPPFPSNAYFLVVGVMRYQVVEVFAGFMLGRFLLYWLTVYLVRVFERSFSALFNSHLYTIVVIDLIAFASTVLLTLIDWNKLLEEKRLGIIRPRIRRHRRTQS